MKCMYAQTRPRFILSSEGVFGGMEFEPMLTPREKSPLPKKSPEEDRTRDAVDSEPKHYQLSYSGPIYIDVTGHSTVQCPSKVISVKGQRQVGATTSAERSTNTTGVYRRSVTGHSIPPMLIFKRKRMADTLKTAAPNGTALPVQILDR